MSNPYLHYALDMWFERVVKVRLRCEAHLVHYIDDFVICVQYRSDALRVHKVLRHRLAKFGLILEPTKTKLVEFGRFAQRHADKHGRNRPETIYFFLGLTLYCTHDRKGNFKIGMHTEKSRLRCSLMSLQEPMWQLQHHKISDQSARSTPPSRAIMPITALPETFGRCSRSIAPGTVLVEDVAQPQLSRPTSSVMSPSRSENGPRCCDPTAPPYRELQTLAVV